MDSLSYEIIVSSLKSTEPTLNSFESSDILHFVHRTDATKIKAD